jgi:4-amino-4-deoxy-L-arabinose transferase-like glycosyltransferase
VPRRTHIALALAGLAAGALFLWNLGDCLLWQDEAQTATVAKTVLSGGLPRGFDGRNFLSQELTSEYGPGLLWRWQPWLPFYVLAAVFRLFGQSTFVARLPFALFGLASVPAVYLLARRWSGERVTGLVAAGLLTLNVPFLLLSRQCRYYSLAALCTLLSLAAYHQLIRGETARRRPLIALVVASTLLFHVHYIYVGTLYLTLLAHAALFHRAALRPVATAALAAAVVNAPWIVWFGSMSYGARYGGQLGSLAAPVINASGFAWSLVSRTWPPALLLVLLAGLGLGLYRDLRREERSQLALCGLFCVINVAVLSLTSPGPFFRYLSPLLPVGCLALAPLVVRVMRRARVLGTAMVAAAVLSGPLPGFFHELTHHYRGPIDGIIEYLAQNARPGQVVAITYGDLPLKFYRDDLQVLGGLTGEDLTPAAQADFVIVRHHVVCEKDGAVKKWLEDHLDWSRYDKHEVDAPDAMFQNRESLPEHRFRTATDEPKVSIFKRVR